MKKYELKYEMPFEFSKTLAFLEPRAMKGMEVVNGKSYSGTFRIEKTEGYFIVKNNPVKSALELTVNSKNAILDVEIQNRVRRMFDLDTEFETINKKFSRDKLLSSGMKHGHVPRLPIAFDPFEFVVRAVLGQQISVKAATTLAARVVEKAKLKTAGGFPTGLDYFFPNPSEMLNLDLDGLGITKTRQETLKTVARGVLDGSYTLTADQDFEAFQKEFSSLKGVGDWTVNYVAMRGLGMIDSFPASDLGVIKALTSDGNKPSKKKIMELAEAWRPYRTYATLCLWNLSKN